MEISLEVILFLFGSVMTLQLWTLKRLNFTCNMITKINTFLKIKFPRETKGVL